MLASQHDTANDWLTDNECQRDRRQVNPNQSNPHGCVFWLSSVLWHNFYTRNWIWIHFYTFPSDSHSFSAGGQDEICTQIFIFYPGVNGERQQANRLLTRADPLASSCLVLIFSPRSWGWKHNTQAHNKNFRSRPPLLADTFLNLLILLGDEMREQTSTEMAKNFLAICRDGATGREFSDSLFFLS